VFNFNEMVNGIFTQYEAEVRARANDIANAIYDIRAALWSQVDDGVNGAPETSKFARITQPVGLTTAATIYTVPKGSRAILRGIYRASTNPLNILIDDAALFSTGTNPTIGLDIPLRGGERLSALATTTAEPVTIVVEVFTPQVPLVGKPVGVEPPVGSRWTSDGLAKVSAPVSVVPGAPQSMGS
jgi:hypothetical protein